MTAIANERTNTYRRTATAVGALFVAGMVIGIMGTMLVQSVLDAPDRLAIIPANSVLVAFGAILLLLTAAGDAAHGILMLPILKERSEHIAFGYFGFRIVDGVFLAVGAIFLLLQIPLGREYLNAAAPGNSYLQALSALAIQANLNAYNIAMTSLGIAGLMLCYMFFKARLVPRPLAVWGLVGYAVILGGSLLAIMGFNLGSLHVIPGGLWEIFVGVWLMAKGFNASAFTPPTTETGNMAATLVAPPEPA